MKRWTSEVVKDKKSPLFTLSHKGSDNSHLLIVFSANYINQLNRDFYATEEYRKYWPFLTLVRLCQWKTGIRKGQDHEQQNSPGCWSKFMK